MTEPSSHLERAAANTTEALQALFGPASPAAIFSSPERLDDQLVITAASWERAGGFGFGGGGDTGPSGSLDGGGGGGGGGTSVGRPVAVITVGADGVRVEPVIDLTKLAVTALLSALGVWRVLR